MTFDLDTIRNQFPSLDRPAIFLDEDLRQRMERLGTISEAVWPSPSDAMARPAALRIDAACDLFLPVTSGTVAVSEGFAADFMGSVGAISIYLIISDAMRWNTGAATVPPYLFSDDGSSIAIRTATFGSSAGM